MQPMRFIAARSLRQCLQGYAEHLIASCHSSCRCGWAHCQRLLQARGVPFNSGSGKRRCELAARSLRGRHCPLLHLVCRLSCLFQYMDDEGSYPGGLAAFDDHMHMLSLCCMTSAVALADRVTSICSSEGTPISGLQPVRARFIHDSALQSKESQPDAG